MWHVGSQVQAYASLWPNHSKNCSSCCRYAALDCIAWKRAPRDRSSRYACFKRKLRLPLLRPPVAQARQLEKSEGLAGLRQEPLHRQRVSIFYNTAWEQAYLHGSLNGGRWEDHRFSRVNPSGGNLWVLHLAVSSNGNTAGVPLLEFVIHNGVDYDKRADGCNYSVSQAGTYLLDFGTLSKVKGQAIMTVSDMDDLMIGNDEASKAFKDFWEKDAQLRGSCLVYNTGGALDNWLSLWKEKSTFLAAPDVLITSMGTRIYNAAPDTFQGWSVDEAYAKKIEQGWQLELVREAAYKALVSVGKDSVHFLPKQAQNSVKITLGVRTNVLLKVQDMLQKNMRRGSVDMQMIVSGRDPDWRFVDLIPRGAGIFAAMEHVRQRMGFAPEHMIACVSGNDRDMLAGQASNIAVVLANANPMVRKRLAEEHVSKGIQNNLYTAKEDMAYGILEGLEHFGFKCASSSK